ncbi:NAD(P)H-dependent flavin oxidoreductase [Edaphobacillus lindanitolerans]|uniref:Probable nitronate monooxygenase n=1 Tax=Edaphobacillus lindanitolerans TaxID=550447 RepID=A0A1U7PRM4_9BACI|nr:nitronate monooxygenase [Edaphobacillus lindanitolerans]SIT88556.1 nitronate monooxygenase [Edaphobacillus lindanitolerans]
MTIWWKRFNLKYPMIQAPMAGSTPPAFVAASCEAGILGSLGAGYMTADKTRAAVQEIKKRTDRPFSVNLFVPENPVRDGAEIGAAHEALAPYRRELGLADELPALSASEFDGQVRVLIEEKVPVVSFTFGLPGEGTVQGLKSAGAFLIGTATTPEEADAAARAGMDAVVLQGKEAGGHRGSFLGEDRFMKLADLLAETGVSIPVIAAGGIHDAETAGGALAAGASAVQVGTALLVSEESGAHPLHKQAILDSGEGDTVLTRAFSGKNARGVSNRFIREMAVAPIAPYPVQNDLTKPIRAEAGKRGDSGLLSLWAGENGWRNEGGPLAEIVRRLAAGLGSGD